MKKKGLIIATIVMVLVLAVSLTTATYAWFTTTSATTIESITVKAAAGAEVKVGMKANNTYVEGASQDTFVSGSLTWDGSTPWTGDPGMGFEVNTGLSLASISKATGYGTPNSAVYTANASGTYYKLTSEKYTTTAPTDQTLSNYELVTVADQPYTGAVVGQAVKYAVSSGTVGTAAKFVPGTSSGSQIIKASGTAHNVYDPSSVELATENVDYLHFVLGVAPSVATINSITISLFVNPGTNKNAIGVEAALYCYYKIDGGSVQGGEIYDTYGSNTAITYNTTKSSISSTSTVGDALNALYSNQTSYTDNTGLNVGWREIDVRFGSTSGAAMAADTVHQVEFWIFYDGTDTDCINSALGSECGIIFAITNTKAA